METTRIAELRALSARLRSCLNRSDEQESEPMAPLAQDTELPVPSPRLTS
jgi:hypothetical protein